jgi:hypothetical protein
VAATTQFLLKDAAPLKRSPVTGKAYKVGSREYWFTYQSGLYNTRNRAKPAAYAYAFPFVVFPAGEGTVGYWGQARFRPNLGADTILILWRPDARSEWQQLSEFVTESPRNFFGGSVPLPAAGGEYAAAYWNAEEARIGAYSLPSKLG